MSFIYSLKLLFINVSFNIFIKDFIICHQIKIFDNSSLVTLSFISYSLLFIIFIIFSNSFSFIINNFLFTSYFFSNIFLIIQFLLIILLFNQCQISFKVLYINSEL